MDFPVIEEWAEHGACRDRPEVDWFPDGRAHAEMLRAQREAIAVCRACPVRAECAEAGIEERFGVWGGTTERERARLRAARRGSAA